MTVGAQVKQTIAGLKSPQASLETFALGTENQIEQEEPQYKS